MNSHFLSAKNSHLLKIRLSRRGKKSQPSYRIVVQEHSSPIKGKFIDEVGTYMPASNPKFIQFDQDKIKHWLSVGAQPSDTVASLLKKEGMQGMDQYIAPRDKKRKKKNAPEEEEAPAAPAPKAEAPAEEAPKEEAKAEEKAEAPAEEAPKEEAKAEEKAEAPKEEPASEEKADA